MEVSETRSKPGDDAQHDEGEYGVSLFSMIYSLIQRSKDIDWNKARAIDRESNKMDRWIKDTIHVRKEQNNSINRQVCSFLYNFKATNIPTTTEMQRCSACMYPSFKVLTNNATLTTSCQILFINPQYPCLKQQQ